MTKSFATSVKCNARTRFSTRTGSRPPLDDLRVLERSDELDAEPGVGGGTVRAELGLGEHEVELVGVDHNAGCADDDQLAVLHVSVHAHSPRSDHRIGEVERDPAQLR